MILTSLLATYILFGLMGIFISRKIKVKPGPLGWIILASLVLISQWILPGTRIIVIFDFHMYANRILQAFFFGILTGLLMKKSGD